jgi:hypothetical protein
MCVAILHGMREGAGRRTCTIRRSARVKGSDSGLVAMPPSGWLFTRNITLLRALEKGALSLSNAPLNRDFLAFSLLPGVMPSASEPANTLATTKASIVDSSLLALPSCRSKCRWWEMSSHAAGPQTNNSVAWGIPDRRRRHRLALGWAAARA